MIKEINNELAYNTRCGYVYSNLRDLKSYFTIGKCKISDDGTKFIFEASKDDIKRTIHNTFEDYVTNKIIQFRRDMESYNYETRTDYVSMFIDNGYGTKINKNIKGM